MARVLQHPKEARRGAALWLAAALLAMAAGFLWAPDKAAATAAFVLESFITVAPLVLAGILVSAWVSAAGLGGAIARAFQGRALGAVLLASAVGAITPVCGVTVLPLMTGLLAAGVPLAPVMAFWLSSPVTDPALFAATAATLGPAFALGKTLAAFLMGIFAGLATGALSSRAWVQRPLR